MRGSGCNKEEESTSLSVVDVGIRWGNSPVRARSCNVCSSHSSNKSTRGTAIVRVLLSADGVWHCWVGRIQDVNSAAKGSVKPLLGLGIFGE